MKVVISGYGRMGHMVEAALAERGVSFAGASEDITSFDKALAKECVCVDFTTPDAFRSDYKFLADNFKAVVVGTTGWDDIRDEVIRYFESKGTPMIYSSNFSVGVNALLAAVGLLSESLGKAGGYSPYITEKHHIHKLDARAAPPSLWPRWSPGRWARLRMWLPSGSVSWPGSTLWVSRGPATGSRSPMRPSPGRGSPTAR